MLDVAVTDLGHDLYLIDAGMHDEPERLACYFFDTPEPVLVECGPSRTLPNLTAALDHIGVTDLAAVVVTHIHLDHAGGAGHVAARFPRAKVGVHGRGARHLADPSRLWASATRIYGDEGMDRMWGPMEPIPEDRLLVVDEGDRIPLGGGRSLEVMYTPGHASHHVVYFDAETGGCFVGDAVGMAFPHGHIVQPETPPPDFDLDLTIEQLHRIAARDPDFLGFAHFGINREPRQALAEAEARLRWWVDTIAELPTDDVELAASRLRESTLAAYRTEGHPERVVAQYDAGAYWHMHVSGVQRWLAQRAAAESSA